MRAWLTRLGEIPAAALDLAFSALVIVSVVIGGVALYGAPVPAEDVVPPVYADPAAFAGRPGVYVEGVIAGRLGENTLEVTPITGGKWQDDPRLLVVLGPGAAQARLRSPGQEVFFWGTVLRTPEDVPPGTDMTPEAEELLQQGRLFFFAERM